MVFFDFFFFIDETGKQSHKNKIKRETENWSEKRKKSDNAKN